MAIIANANNSPYNDLYISIEKLRGHGLRINDPRVMNLAITLTFHLTDFEANPNKNNAQVKHNFRNAFIDTLHSEDRAFDKRNNPTKPFLGLIYNALYGSVFGNEKSHHSYFFSCNKRDRNTPERNVKSNDALDSPTLKK